MNKINWDKVKDLLKKNYGYLIFVVLHLVFWYFLFSLQKSLLKHQNQKI